ncbi:MAG: hypothetical protein ACPGU7_13080 [Gammaproteobacteria bacterium]
MNDARKDTTQTRIEDIERAAWFARLAFGAGACAADIPTPSLPDTPSIDVMP